MKFTAALRSGLSALLMLCAISGCAEQKVARDVPVLELRIVDSPSLRLDDPKVDLRSAIDKRTEQFGKVGGLVGAGAGCAAGGAGSVALMIWTGGTDPTGTIVVGGCILGGFALLPVGWALGAGIGVAAGAAEGLIGEVSEAPPLPELASVERAFQELDVSPALETALLESVRRFETPVTIVGDRLDEEDEGTPLPEMVLVVKITELALEFPGWLSSSAALRVSARGAVHAPGRPLPQVEVGTWRARSDSTDLDALLAEPPLEMERMSEQALRALAEEISEDVGEEIAGIQTELAAQSTDEPDDETTASDPDPAADRGSLWDRLFSIP